VILHRAKTREVQVTGAKTKGLRRHRGQADVASLLRVLRLSRRLELTLVRYGKSSTKARPLRRREKKARPLRRSSFSFEKELNGWKGAASRKRFAGSGPRNVLLVFQVCSIWGRGALASTQLPAPSANVTYAERAQQGKQRPAERYKRTWCCVWNGLSMVHG
jgi:hypothetical protein